jgi:hypothetical protein
MCLATELAWAAGFFDGEGWTSASKRTFWLGIAQKDIRPLERFVDAVGVGRIYDNRIHTVALTGAKALKVLTALWPLLSEPKREKARADFEVVQATRSRRYPKLNATYDAFEEVIRRS